ncbi:hypothetical protein JJO83_13055 [Halomonas aquamarina]|uniref:hypothetical protein n=1 Tax=Vreelandella aquamarina TaxID=77097 RepID=UPI0023595DE1|nr:hypothetical protein [Halomonas aquamarina]MDC8443619.1 hypothetical protein [Halomonas aquamarina]
MKPNATTISTLYVVEELVPRLNAVDNQIEKTISAIINAGQASQIERYSKLQAEFQLELTMIRMNLEHLLKRYSQELAAVVNDPRQDVLLTLDAYEATAIENAKQLYRRVQALQTQGVT